MTVRPALLWRLSNFPSSCVSLLPWRRSPVACGLPLRCVPPLDVSSFVLPSDRMRASWSLPLVVSPCELRAYYSTRRDSFDAQAHARQRQCSERCWNRGVYRRRRPGLRLLLCLFVLEHRCDPPGDTWVHITHHSAYRSLLFKMIFAECQVQCRTARQLTPSQPRCPQCLKS